MGLSETIVAASIGAAATVCAAMFQLFTALRTNKFDARAKRGTTLKSIVAVGALMAVSAVGGFLFSEFRNEHSAQDLRSMRDELNAKLQVLATTTEKLAAARVASPVSEVRTQTIAPAMATLQSQSASMLDRAESFVYAPACTSNCSEGTAAVSNICVSIPSAMQVRRVELSIKRDASEPVRTEFNQDLGGAKFIGSPAEYQQAENHKAVCVSFAHWSEQSHTATAVMYYGPPVEMRAIGDSTTSSAGVVSAPGAIATPAVTMAASAAVP